MQSLALLNIPFFFFFKLEQAQIIESAPLGIGQTLPPLLLHNSYFGHSWCLVFQTPQSFLPWTWLPTGGTQNLPPLKSAPAAPWGMSQEWVLVGKLKATNSREDLKIKGYKFQGVNQRKSGFQLDCC